VFQMNYAVIAAGDGKRLIEEGIKTPKPLIKINGIEMIKRLLDIFEDNNATKVSVIVNESFKEVKDFISSQKNQFPIEIKVKSTPSSMHSLYELKQLIGNTSFCLTTVDTIFNEEEFKLFINYAESQKDKDAVMGITSFIDDEKPLFIKTQGDRIIEFSDDKKNSIYVSGGIYFFRPVIWEVLQNSINAGTNRMRNFQRDLLKAGLNVGFYEFSKIIDVDHVKDIETAENLNIKNN